MRRPIVAGNWKMHGSRAENARLLEELLAGAPAQPKATCVVCPPFVYLQEAARLLRDSALSLGAQDVCADAQGAFTGEVSAAMLKDVGCEYVIVGHSERRLLYRESDQLVARKFGAALAKGLIPILCVGEQLADREAGRTQEVVGAAARCGAGALRGRRRSSTPWSPTSRCGRSAPDATPVPSRPQEVHAFIRAAARRRGMLKLRAATRILYGGSVKAGNAAELFAMPDVDGGLIGGASLKADEFLTILAAAGRDE